MAKRIDCSELAKTMTEFALHIASRENVRTLDDVVAGVQEDFPLVRRQDLVDAIVEATAGRQREVDDLTAKLNEIKREARTDKQLQNKITDLEKTLESGEVPERAKRIDKSTNAIKQLRSIRDDLQKKVRLSEPVQRERLEKQIEVLNQRLESGDILPKTREVEPKSKELETLEFQRDELQREIRQRLENLKPRNWFEKFIAEPFNTARAIMTAYDLSGVFRQGGFFVIGRPIGSIQAFKEMNKALISRQAFTKIDAAIKDSPFYLLARKAKLFLAPIDGTYQLSQLEEAFQTNWARKIPGIAASERAYITFLNKQRMDMFTTLVQTITKDGEATLEEAKSLATFVNVATGRGGLAALERAAVPMNTIFFAPRYVSSRFQLLLGVPLFQAKGRARQVIAKEYARYLIGMGLIYSVMAFVVSVYDDEDKISIEDDPRSSDFGKIKIGDTRLDPLSGLSQTIVLLSRLVGGKTKSSISGKITPLVGKQVPIWSGGLPGVVGRFLRTKFSPLVSFFVDIRTGENVIGEPVNFKGAVWNMRPLAMGEIWDTMKAQNIPAGTALSILAVLGMGVQTYGSQMNAMSVQELRKELVKNVYKRRFKYQKRIQRDDGTYFTTGPIRWFPRGAAHRGKEDKVKAIRKALARKKAESIKK